MGLHFVEMGHIDMVGHEMGHYFARMGLFAAKNGSETVAKIQEICGPFIQFFGGHQPSSGLVLPPLSAQKGHIVKCGSSTRGHRCRHLP